VGGLNVDVHLHGVRSVEAEPTFTAQRVLVTAGGKGANAARSAARLGARVTLVGKVGADVFGALAVDAAARDGVDVDFVTETSENGTGFAAIRLQDGQHRTVIWAPGANEDLTWGEVMVAEGALQAADAILVQAEVPAGVLRRLSSWSQDSGKDLYLDPVPPELVTPEALAAAVIVTPNRYEAEALAGDRVDSPESARRAAEMLLEAGAGRVGLKLDVDGTLLVTADGSWLIPTLAVEAVDETGAGDVYLAALAVRRGEGASWEEAVRFANAAAALSVADPGLSLPGWQEVEAALA
ncbi:MAG: PfkB family carbohydrate kinase, partial [Acidimicrobiia bacterium]